METILPAAVNTLMENEQQNLRQATDDEAARQYSLQDAAEPLDGDHLDVDNPRRQQHYESSTITAKQLELQLPDTPSREKEPQRQSRCDGGIEDDDLKTKRTFVAVRQVELQAHITRDRHRLQFEHQPCRNEYKEPPLKGQQHALADKRTAPTESSSSGQHPTGTQSSGECESGVRNSTIHPQLLLG